MATDLLVSTLKDVADAGFSDDMYANAIVSYRKEHLRFNKSKFALI